jgi:hypothetical protein
VPLHQDYPLNVRHKVSERSGAYEAANWNRLFLPKIKFLREIMYLLQKIAILQTPVKVDGFCSFRPNPAFIKIFFL